MSSKRIRWITLDAFILFASGFALYFAICLPAQTPTETQSQTIFEKPASTEPLIQGSSETSILTNTPEPLPTRSLRMTKTPEIEAATAVDLSTPPMIIAEDSITQVAPFFMLIGHSDDVSEVAFSPDSSLVASSSADGTIRLWSVTDGSLVYVLEGHTDHILCLAFSPEGTLLASGSADSTVRIWQISDGTLVRTISSYSLGRVLDVEFSPDGSLLAIADHLCHVQLRWVNSGILYRTLAQPNCIAYQDGTVYTWGLAFSPSGEQIVTGEGRPCCGGSLQIWQVEDEFTQPQLLEGYNLRIRDLTFTPDGSKIAVAFLGNSVFWLIDVEDGSFLQAFEGHTYRVNSMAFSPDGKLLVSGPRDQKVRLWQVENGELILTLEGHNDEVNSVAFSQDGSMIASGSSDNTVILWARTENPNH